MSFHHWIGVLKRVLGFSVANNPHFFCIVFSAYFVTFCILLPWLCNDWAYSKYFSSAWKKEDLAKQVMDRNRVDVEKAKNMISDLDIASTLSYYKNLERQYEVELVIGVITLQRILKDRELGYLTQVMAELNQLFQNDQRFTSKVLFICNIHAGKGAHAEADMLSQYFSTVMKSHGPDPSATTKASFEREKQDYVFCLEQATEYHPKYILLIQDDAVPRDDLFPVLGHVLDNYVENRQYRGTAVDNTNRWASLKLYYPEKWQGYASEKQPILELCGLGVVGGSIAVFLLKVLYSCKAIKTKRNYSILSELLAFLLGAIYFVLLAVLIGRQYLLELRRLSPYLYSVGPSANCCIPGSLYPAQVVPELINYLKQVTCTANFGVDLAVDNFVLQNGYQRFSVTPNLFKHIGYVSTTKGPSRNPEQFLF